MLLSVLKFAPATAKSAVVEPVLRLLARRHRYCDNGEQP